MSLFGKKAEPTLPMNPASPAEEPAAPRRGYGIGELIRLLKTIPVDQHPDLVVRVVKTTLESVGVHSSHVIDDAVRQEAAIGERIAALESEIEGLTSQIHQRKEQIAALQVELSETTYAKERLQSAEGAQLAPPPERTSAAPKTRSLPPPLPPPFHKSSSGKPPEPATGT
jgi:hypothetical protein